MKITSLTLRNVKSFKEKQTILFNNSLNIFIGKNGSGKSTVLDIIKTLMNFPMIKYSSYLKQLEEKTFVQNQTDNSEPLIEFKIKFSKNDFEQFDHIYDITSKDDKGNIPDWFKNKVERIKNLINQEIDFSNNSFELGLKYNFKKKKVEAELKENTKMFLAILKAFSIKHHFISKQLLENGYKDFRDDRGVCSPLHPLSPTLSIASKKFNNGFQEFEHKYYHLYEGECKGDLIGNMLFVQHMPKGKQTVAETFAWKYFSKLLAQENDIKISTHDTDPERVMVPDGLPVYGLKNSNSNTSRKVLIKDASDGEYCLLNQQLLRAYDLKNSIIFIDEPEIHLHPQAQKQFLNQLEELLREMESQIFISTHSPILITSETIRSSYRIYYDKEKQSSQIRSFEEKNIPRNQKNDKLAELVNLDFAEKALFANKVVLVEGQSDKAFFEILLKYKKQQSDLIEVIATGGKHNFKHYLELLSLLQFEKKEVFILADRDYLEQVGSSQIKQIISNNKNKSKCIKKIKESIASKDSKDKENLCNAMNSLLAEPENKMYQDYFKSIWTYIVDRANKADWNKIVSNDEFPKEIKSKFNDNTFILSKGELEDYLKDLIIIEPFIRNTYRKIDCKLCLGDNKKASSNKIRAYLDVPNRVQYIFTTYPELEKICNKIIN